MRTTTYKCDRCGASDTDNKLKLGQIRIAINDHYDDRYSERHAEWCKTCRIETGIDKRPQAKDEEITHAQPQTHIPTLEEMIREIVRQEIEQ